MLFRKIIFICYGCVYRSGRTVFSVGLRPLVCWECGLKSNQGHGYLSLVSVVCFQVEVSATGRSIFQGSPPECGVFDECDREAPIVRKS
jgi:hypothetical protein